MAGGGYGELFVGDDCFTIDFCCDWGAVGVDNVDLLHGADCVVDLIGELCGVAGGDWGVCVVAVHGGEAEVFAVGDCGGNICEGLGVLHCV